MLSLTVQAAFFPHAGENPAPAVPADGLTVLVEEQYPPFSYTDGKGVLTGFDVEVAEGICRELGTACRIRPVRMFGRKETVQICLSAETGKGQFQEQMPGRILRKKQRTETAPRN